MGGTCKRRVDAVWFICDGNAPKSLPAVGASVFFGYIGFYSNSLPFWYSCLTFLESTSAI